MSRRGFTILELMLVIAVMVLVAALAWPSIDAMYSDVRLSAGSDQIRGHWAEARTRAIEDLRPYRFGVVPGTGKFKIAPFDDGTNSFGGSDVGAEGQDVAPPLTIEATLPDGVLFAEESTSQAGDDDSDGYSTIVIFRPDGTADRDVEIVFQADGCRPLQLRLRGLTGAVSAKWLEAGDAK